MILNYSPIKVAVYDKVRVFYKTDKHLGGLIQTYSEMHSEKLGRTISLHIPFLDKYDKVMVNGMEFAMVTKKAKK